MNREPYHYTRLFTEPIKIRYVGNYIRLPFSVALMDGITFVLSAILIYLFFHPLIAQLNKSSTLFGWGAYSLVPYGMVTLINKLRPEGKKIHYYLWDMLVYYWQWQRPKRKVCNGRIIDNQTDHTKNYFRLLKDNKR